MTSAIDATKPADAPALAVKADMRANFAAAKSEILALQAAGGGSSDSEGITYLAPYTGSVSRTAEAKLSERVSIKDFGAVCNGSTDDTAAWTAAVAYLKTRGLVNDSRDRPILWVPAYTKFDPSGITWDWPIHIVLEGNIFITKPWQFNCPLTLTGAGSECGAIQQSRGPISIIYTTGAGPWTGGAIWLRYQMPAYLENIGVFGPPGAAAVLIGELPGTTPILNSSSKFFYNCAFQANNSAGASGVSIENAIWIYFTNCSFVAAASSRASLWITDNGGAASLVNNTGLLQLQNCNIATKGIHFGTTGGPSGAGGSHYWFDEIHFENAVEAFFVFENANQNRLDFKLDRLNFADIAGTPPFYLIDNTIGAAVGSVEITSFQCGNPLIQLWAGKLPYDGLMGGKFWQSTAYPATVYDVIGQFPIRRTVNIEGRWEFIDTFAGRDFAPQMLPANAVPLTVGDTNSTAYYINNGGTITMTGGQLAPDGSSTAIKFANGGGATDVAGRWDNVFGSVTNHWVVVGAWFRQENQAVAIFDIPDDVTKALINLQAQNGSGVTVDGVSTTNVAVTREYTAQNANVGWQLVWKVGLVVSSGTTSWQSFIAIAPGQTLRVWNLFAFALPTSVYTRRDVAAIMSKLATVNCGAKPGVLAQLSHQTFRTGAGATAARPSAATVGAGAQWFDTDLGLPIWSDGTSMISPLTLRERTITTANTIGAADHGKRVICTSAATHTVSNAATLGAGFECEVLNDSGGSVILNGPGATDVTLADGEVVTLICANSKIRVCKGASTVIS